MTRLFPPHPLSLTLLAAAAAACGRGSGGVADDARDGNGAPPATERATDGLYPFVGRLDLDGPAQGGSAGATGTGDLDSARPETCDGLDNDRNGHIDESCICTVGTAQPCFAGRPSQAGVGACVWGEQRCDPSVVNELGLPRWGACLGSGSPAAETCDAIDNDCDGTPDEALTRACTTACGPGVESCTSGTWSGCDARPPEAERCDNEADDDCDGTPDCDDPDCARDLACKPACDPSTAREVAQPLPLDLYVLLDGSGSMGTDCAVGDGIASKWCYAINALHGFFGAASSAGNRVALQYFPRGGQACADGGALATPAVPLGVLPDHAAALRASLDAWVPSGNTPTEAAIRGLSAFTARSATPGRAMVGVLITDGEPTECNMSANELGALLATHVTTTGLPTYVIGMRGASTATLEALAVGGGTPAHTSTCSGATPCHYYDVGDGDPQAFIAALQAIQHAAVGCSYQAPAGRYTPTQVVVTTATATGTVQLPRVADAASCSDGAGFYLDAGTPPTALSLCPASCAALQNDVGAEVSLRVDCSLW